MDLTAEKEGFEPPVPRGTTVFKTAAFDHSAISPERDKSRIIFQTAKGFSNKKYIIDKKKSTNGCFIKTFLRI